MEPLIHLPIQRKLTLIMLLTSSVALVIAIGALVLFDQVFEHQQNQDRLRFQARMIAEHCRTALVTQQHDLLWDLLATLDAEPSIAGACLYNARTNIIAHFIKDEAPDHYSFPEAFNDSDEAISKTDFFWEPIRDQGETLAFLYLLADRRPLQARLLNYLSIGGIALLVSFAVAIILSTFLQRFISHPIIELSQLAQNVANTKNYSLRAKGQSHDEIGRLIKVFNEMLRQIQAHEKALHAAQSELEDRVVERTTKLSQANDTLRQEIAERKKARSEVVTLNTKLIETTRRAGMAEVASEVLHNVGNVLNSVNVAAGVIRHRLQDSEVRQFNAVVDLLHQNRDRLPEFLTQDPKGRKLPDYFQSFAQYLASEEQTLLKEVEGLSTNIDHIKEIVATQQRHTKAIGLRERREIAPLVEEVIALYRDSLHQSGIVVISEYDGDLEVTLDTHKVIQILANLILNAQEALTEAQHEQKQIFVSVRVTAEHQVAIQVKDNGPGIVPENLQKIFTHGFTTKQHGHGFGLHSCALAAQEMRGSLRVKSEGTGKGATFILELPLE